MLKAYKYRIYPNAEQEEMFEKHFGSTRFVYNWALSFHKRYYGMFKKRVGKLSHSELMAEIQSRLVKKKKTEKFSWLNDVNSQSLLYALFNLNDAFLRCYRGQNQHPKFKAKHYSKRSFQCPQRCKLDVKRKRLSIPKVKDIKINLNRQFSGKIKTITISKSASGKYFASILVKDDKLLPIPTIVDENLTLGIDLGIAHFLTTSKGEKIDNPRCLGKYLKKVKIEHKILSRKKKNGKNRGKQRLAVARIHEKVRNKRLDFHHKLVHYLVCENQETSFAVEDLAVKNMIKNRKLARAIQDVAWGQFLRILNYKAAWNAKNVLKVDRFFASTKICSHCSFQLNHLPLVERHWTCSKCGSDNDRDINASINIRNQALVDLVGDTSS